MSYAAWLALIRILTNTVLGSSRRVPQAQPPLVATGWTARPRIFVTSGPVTWAQSVAAVPAADEDGVVAAIFLMPDVKKDPTRAITRGRMTATRNSATRNRAARAANERRRGGFDPL